MKRDEPIFFKCKYTKPTSVPDAVYIRSLGTLKGDVVCEIIYRDQKWIVRESEIESARASRNALLSQWEWEIQTVATPKQFKYQMAKKLGISTNVLRNRQKLIAEWRTTSGV